MDDTQYLDAIRRDSAALLDAAGAADASTVIEACPDWRPVDLVWHIGEVHHFWGSIVADRLTDPDDYEEPARPASDTATYEFAADANRLLVDALAATDPSTEVWTWSSQNDVAFVLRRMAQETAVHRADAERAAGRAYRIEPELASDGIDEYLFHFLSRWPADTPSVGGTVHLHCTDVAGEWFITPDDEDRYVVTREHAKGDAALRGPAHDLLMALWRRLPVDALDVVGDRSVAERFLARTDND